MFLQRLKQLIDAGKQPIIEFQHKEIENTIGYSVGMKTRVVSYSVEKSKTGLEPDLCKIVTNFKEFVSYNRDFDRCGWENSDCYPSDFISEFYLMDDGSENYMVKIVSDTKLFDLYNGSEENKQISYTEWLEYFIKNANPEYIQRQFKNYWSIYEKLEENSEEQNVIMFEMCKLQSVADSIGLELISIDVN